MSAESCGPIRDWLRARQTVRRPIVWGAGWVVAAVALNAAGVYLAFSAFLQPVEVLSLSAAETRVDVPAGAVSPVGSFPLKPTDGVPVGPVTVEYTVGGVSLSHTFPEGTTNYVLPVPTPGYLPPTDPVETPVIVVGVRGAGLGKPDRGVVVFPPVPFVTFAVERSDVNPDRPFAGADVYVSGKVEVVDYLVFGPADRSVPLRGGRLSRDGSTWRVPAEALPEATSIPGDYLLRLIPPPGARLGAIGEHIVRVTVPPPPVLARVIDWKAETERVAADADAVTFVVELDKPATSALELAVEFGGTAGGRVVNAPKAVAVEAMKRSGKVTVRLKPPATDVTSDQELTARLAVPADRRGPDDPADRTAVAAIAAPIPVPPRVVAWRAKVDKLAADADAVTFVVELDKPATSALELAVEFGGTAGGRVVNAPKAVAVEAMKRSGEVTVRLNSSAADDQQLTAKLTVLADRRGPDDPADRTAVAAIAAPTRFPLTIQVPGEKVLNLADPKSEVRVVFDISPRKATAKIEIALEYDDGKGNTAVRGEHFVGPATVTIEKGESSAEVKFVAKLSPRVAPDRRFTVRFGLPGTVVAAAKLQPLEVRITEDAAVRPLLVLVVRSADPAAADKHWEKILLKGWEDDAALGRKRWVRGLVVGRRDGEVVAEPLGSDAAAKLDPVGARPGERIVDTLDAVFDARRKVLDDLTPADRAKIVTVVAWPSNASPRALEVGKAVRPLGEKTVNELAQMPGRFAFVWYAREISGAQADEFKPLTDAIRGAVDKWPAGQKKDCVRVVDKESDKSGIAEAVEPILEGVKKP